MPNTVTVDRDKLLDILKASLNPNLAQAVLDDIIVQTAVSSDAVIDFNNDEVRVWLGSGDWGAVYVNGGLWMERHHDDIQERFMELLETQFNVIIEYNDEFKDTRPPNPRSIAHKLLSDFA